MINPGKIAFDIDGVVANTMKLFIEIAKEDHGITHISCEDMTCYILEECLDMDEDIILDILRKLTDGSHNHRLEMMEGAKRVLSRIGQKHAPLCFVTARSDKKSIRAWLANNLLPDKPEIDVIATGAFEAKADVLLEKGIGFFVEDRLDTCFLLHEAGITPVVFIQPWNREPHPFTEVGSWSELEALIEF